MKPTQSLCRIAGRFCAVLAVLLLSALVLCPLPAGAQMYKWTDENGNVHFTDNLFNVPSQELHQVRTYDNKELAPVADPRIPLNKSEMGYVVEAVLAGRETVRLLVDTGASSTVISPGVMERMGIEVSRDPPVIVRTANGETEAGWAELSTMAVGAQLQGPIRVVVHDAVPGLDGLLGMDFLEAYRVEILTTGPTLKLSPP